MILRFLLAVLFTTTAFSSSYGVGKLNVTYKLHDCETYREPTWLKESPLADIYTVEMAMKAALEGSEINFEDIMRMFNIRLLEWLDGIDIASTGEGCRAMYALHVTFFIASNAAFFAATNAARDVADFVAGNAAFFAARTAAINAAFFAARTAAINAAFFAANYATSFVTGVVAGNTVFGAAINYAKGAPFDAARDAARDAAIKAFRKGKTPVVVGRIAYRIAERTALIYLFEHLFEILSAAYNVRTTYRNPDKSILINIFDRFNSPTDSAATRLLLTPFTLVLRAKIEKIPSPSPWRWFF